MRHPLRVGQVFRCAKFTGLVNPVAHGPDGRFTLPPSPDRSRLHFNHTGRTTCVWTEHGQNGWERQREAVVDLTPEDASTLGTKLFRVLRTEVCGGGQAHGPGDTFPDGHQVIAREEEAPHRLVRFMQTGCFMGMRPPEDIELIEGPLDAVPSEPPEPPDLWREGMQVAADEILDEQANGGSHG